MTLRRKGRPIALKTNFPASRGVLASLHASLVGGTSRRETTQVRDARIPFNRPEMQPRSGVNLALKQDGGSVILDPLCPLPVRVGGQRRKQNEKERRRNNNTGSEDVLALALASQIRSEKVLCHAKLHICSCVEITPVPFKIRRRKIFIFIYFARC